MTNHTDPVAKVRIVLDGRFALLSRKNAIGKANHGKLEMFGGHLEPDETPLQGLLRELREEETSGDLARLVAAADPKPRSAVVDDAMHHLFEVDLQSSDCAELSPHPDESLGLERVPTAELRRRWDDLTWRTQRIFEAFDL